MATKILDSFVRSLSAPEKGQTITYDTEIKGFGIRVTKAGAKSFILNYRFKAIERRITIGSYPDWTVQAAREHAKELKRQIDLGQDPMAERHYERSAPTLNDLWERYELEHLPRKAAKSQYTDRLNYRNHVATKLGKLKLDALTHSDLDGLHRFISTTTPTTANRVISLVRKMMSLAIRWGWRADNPAKGVHLNSENKREVYLTPEEIGRVLDVLAIHPERTSCDAITLLILTGSRKGEVLNADWSQFDLDNGLWVKPSAHTKQRKVHRLPLSDDALQILRRRKAEASSKWVFPSLNDKPLGHIYKIWQRIIQLANIPPVRIHDLRHSYASLLVSNGSTLPVIGALLGHTQVQTTARYAHLMDNPLRAAIQQANLIITRNRTTAPEIAA